MNDYLMNYMRAFSLSDYSLKARGIKPSQYNLKQAIANLKENNYIDGENEIQAIVNAVAAVGGVYSEVGTLQDNIRRIEEIK